MTSSLSTLTRRVVFAPLDDAGRTETVVARIRAAITLGLYADGEQLPNEIALAGQLAVSPVTLRDALRILREEGLVRTARGRNGGTFVVSPRQSNIRLFEKAIVAMSSIELRDLLDWQEAVLCQAARLAADRASEREIDAMRLTVSTLAGTDDPIVARRAYSRFLIELAASARSSRVSKTAIALQVEYAPLSTLILRDTETRAAAAVACGTVLAAVAERRREQAHARMTELMVSLADRAQELHYRLTHDETKRTGRDR